VTAARVLDYKSLGDPGLRGRAAGEAASIIAKIPEVRAALLKFQREFAHQPSGAVLDGRDIGTVVCPDATVKIFVTASPEERARRRYSELRAKGSAITQDLVLEQLLHRDKRDSERVVAPLKPAPDAALLDTTHLDIDAAFRAAVDLIETKAGLAGRSSA
jgi:cytidylate kinase